MPRWRRTPDHDLSQLVSLTAASSRVTADDARRERNAALYGWQIRSLTYADAIGEVWYSSKFYERALRNLILVVQRKQDDGTWKTIDDPEPNALVGELVDANGEQSGLLGMYGRQHFLTGEARLFGTIDPDTNADVWEMLSVEEIRVNADGDYVRQRSPGVPPEIIKAAPPNVFRPTGDAAVMFRLWNPSPRYSDMADSPMRAVLDVCEELFLLTKSVRGEIKSRLSNNGLMGIPSELELPATQQAGRPDEDPGASTLMERLTRAMQIGITDESSAASQIPIIIRGPGELLSKIVHFRFDKPSGDEEAKRTECVKRLATSLDFPPEALLGIADTNHWGAWQIDESGWKVHIQPVAQTLVENLTSAWFRPLTGDANLRLWYDESEVVNHPDRSSDYKDANDRYIISNKAYRKAIGADETDAMSPEEQDRMAQLKALAHRGSDATATPSATGPAAAPAAPAGELPGGGTAGPPDTKPTTAPAGGAQTPPGAVPVPGATKALAAAETAVWRCREIAGSRLRSKVDRDEFAKVSNIDLPPAARSLRVDWNDDALVAGGGAILLRTLTAWNVPPDIAAQIVTATEAHARDTLWQSVPGELPDDVIGLCMLASLDGATR